MEYFRGEVAKIIQEGTSYSYGIKNDFQDIQVKILNGSEIGQTIEMENGGSIQINQNQKVRVGENIILTKIETPDNKTIYTIEDKYRLDWLLPFFIGFVFLVVFIAGKKGVGSLLGLAVSLLVIGKFMIPQILGGVDPLYVTVVGSLVILLVTTYLAHGISRQTTIALLSTFFALVATTVLSIFAVHLTALAGLGSDDDYSLQIGSLTGNINLQGLLISGIIIGTLGALNDITTTQTAAIFEFKKIDPKLKFRQLYQKGTAIGKEHIASLINTLVLAYAGSSLAIFIIFILNPTGQPYWVILNSEVIFDEIVRTLVGSAGLILVVPLVTFLASWYVTNKSLSLKGS